MDKTKEDQVASGLSMHFSHNAQSRIEQNQAMINELLAAMGDKAFGATDADIWEMLAERFSPEWRESRDALLRAQKELDERLNDDNVPLGLIGMALDGGETTQYNDAYSTAIANFTMVNENLRQKTDMQQLMGGLLLAQRAMIAAALPAGVTLSNMSAANAFAQVALPAVQKGLKSTKSAVNKAPENNDRAKTPLTGMASSVAFNEYSKDRKKRRNAAGEPFFKEVINDGVKLYVDYLKKRNTIAAYKAHEKHDAEKRKKFNEIFEPDHKPKGFFA